MNYEELSQLIIRKRSMLCVGLDTHISLIPEFLKKEEDPIFSFNKAIIDATLDYAIAYKPNLAFYESMGIKGWQSLERTMAYLSQFKKEVFTIADAKRGDIGNTSKMYAKTFFEWLDFDAVTVAPYMGEDSVTPFLEYKNKWVILLGLTSNSGSRDFQFLETNGHKLYEEVFIKAQQWSSHEQLMFVVGATHPSLIGNLRLLAEKYFFLVPGIGAQGGDLDGVCKNGMNQHGGLLINSTRQIIYADSSNLFAEKARAESEKAIQPMLKYINNIDH